MNERIIELFEQALEEFKAENKYATIIVPNPLKEKFAELIVRESIVDFYTRYLDTTSNEHITVQVERYVKDQFGVEE